MELLYVAVLWINMAVTSCYLGVDSDEYIGCFRDNPNVPAMTFIDHSEDRTIESCVSTCKIRGNTYAGLQYGGRCYCADRYYDRYGTSTACDFPCHGRASQICGGKERNSVYRVNACPVNCETRTSCSTSGSSCSGCKDGYRGNECDIQCDRNCRNSCAQYGGDCDGCKTGYHGAKCADPCPYRCNNACYQSSGNCYLCKTGYWGDKCTSRCSSNCVDACNKATGRCDACRRGFWGTYCESSCSGCSGDCNQNDGACSACIVGFWGPGCEEICSATCGDSCYKNTGKCGACIEGYWGDTCEKICSANCGATCAQDTGFCTSCPIGYWADTCDNPCSANCAGACDKKSGGCDSCVSERLWGHYCGINCPVSCNGSCDRENGRCMSCEQGYYGNNCDVPCPENCANQGCFMDSGICVICPSGYYGDVCDMKCENCFEGLCNKTTGACQSGCKVGFYLENCKGTCPENCDGCDQEKGICSDGCKSGYFGEVCNELCPRYCHSICDQNNGTCADGCRTGYFGNDCKQSCPSDCYKNACHHVHGSCVAGCENGLYGSFCNFSCAGCLSRCEDSGRCLDGCKAGLMGDMCDMACAAGAFGEQCVGRCHCADNVTCDAVSGDCPHGCAHGWNGTACAQKLEGLTTDSPAGSMNIITGAVVGVGAFIIAGVTVTIIIIKRRRLQSQKDAGDRAENNLSSIASRSLESVTTSPQGNSADVQETALAVEYANLYAHLDSNDVLARGGEKMYQPLPPASVKLPTEKIKQHIKDGNLALEYKGLPRHKEHRWNVAAKPENRGKNRDRNIMAYDHSRVVLEVKGRNLHSDYINANYMPRYKNANGFIASQGPTDHTVEDMWRMVWQVGARIVVMTTDLQEDNKVKCAQYWPDTGSLSYGEFTVTMGQEIIKQHYAMRQLRIERGANVRVVHHFHFSGWADHGVPDSAAPLINFRHLVRRQMGEDEEAPVIVHCSDGSGRAGTYIALDYLLEQAVAEGWVDVPGCVRRLRDARVNMIQNLGQYKFLYEALYEGISTGSTLMTRDSMDGVFTLATQHRILIEDQETLKNQTDGYYEGMELCSQQLPKLPMRNVILHNIPGTTATDFWDFITKHKWTTVLLANDNRKDHADLLPEAGAPIVLPSGVRVQQCSMENMGSVWCARVSVQLPDHEYANVEERKPCVEETYYNVDGVEKMVYVNLIGMRCKTHASYIAAWKHIGPGDVAIISRRLEHGAVFGVSCLLLDQINSFDEVDVFDTVRALRKTHPGLIRDAADYQFLYNVVQSYLQSDGSG